MLGDPSSFIDGLRRAVFGSAFFKRKGTAGTYRQIGEADPEDILQNIWLELHKTGILYSYIDEGLSDEQIAARISRRIKSRIIDAWRARRRENATFCSSVDEDELLRYLPDGRPSPEDEAMGKGLINLIENRLTKRQLFILHNYERFGKGDMQRTQIAKKFSVSVQMIDKEISRIRIIILESAREWRGNLRLGS